MLNLNQSESTKIKSEKIENDQQTESIDTKDSDNHNGHHNSNTVNNLIFGLNQYSNPPHHQFSAFPPNAKWVPLTTHYSSPFAPVPTPQFPPNPTTLTPINIANYQPLVFPTMIPLINNTANNNVINEDDIFGNPFMPTMNHQNSPSVNNPPNPFVFFKQNAIKSNKGKKRKADIYVAPKEKKDKRKIKMYVTPLICRIRTIVHLRLSLIV